MWIARDEDGGLYLYENKPKKVPRCAVYRGHWVDEKTACLSEYVSELPTKLFPELKWEDEPVEVELKIKK